jgi:hypothetical protein
VCIFVSRGIGARRLRDRLGANDARTLRQDEGAIGELKGIVDAMRDKQTGLSELARDAAKIAA